MQQTFVIICLALMVISAAIAVMSDSVLKSCIALALCSGILAIAMFLMGATWAAVFELSVCCGLITVLFISAITVTTPGEKDAETKKDHHRRFSALPFILIFSGVALIAVIMSTGFVISTPSELVSFAAHTFQNVFWNFRQADILGQIFAILAGALAVVVLFKHGGKI